MYDLWLVHNWLYFEFCSATARSAKFKAEPVRVWISQRSCLRNKGLYSNILSEKKIILRKAKIIFDIENWLFKSLFGHFSIHKISNNFLENLPNFDPPKRKLHDRIVATLESLFKGGRTHCLDLDLNDQKTRCFLWQLFHI